MRVDHARAIQGQRRAIEEQSLCAGDSAHRNAGNSGIDAVDSYGIGAVVGYENIVRSGRHLGRTPVGGGIPDPAAADPNDVRGVRVCQ